MKLFISFFLFLQLLFVATIFSQTQPSVGEILNADGTVRLDRDGGYDVEGYKMLIDKDGKPRFLSKTESALSDSGSWSSVGTGSANGVFEYNSILGLVPGLVNALAVYNGELYVGGQFIIAGGDTAKNIARWNGTTWNSVGTGSSNGVNNTVNVMAVYNGELYVGGFFTEAGGISAFRIARWNGTSWNTVGTGLNVSSYGCFAFAEYNGELYVGGNFTGAGGVNANNIGRWNGTNWNSVGTGTNNGVSGSNGFVRAMAVYNGELYVGGEFTNAGGVSANHIARWNGTSWNTLGTGSTNGTGGTNWPFVFALTVYNGELIVGGQFTQAGGITANRIARWDGTSWNSLDTGNNNGISSISYVKSLAVYNGELYIGGPFEQAGGLNANRIIRWDGTNWKLLGNSTANGVSNSVEALAVYNNELYVGGGFRWANWTGLTSTSLVTNGIARWTISGATDVEENEITPTYFILHQNYPNPFNPSTTISFTLPKSSDVTLKVYDVLGREVAELVDSDLQAGSHSINFDASRLSSGTYFYRLQAGDFTQVKKMILIK